MDCTGVDTGGPHVWVQQSVTYAVGIGPTALASIETRTESIAGCQVLGHNVVVKVRDVIRMIEDDGWSIARTRGSHRQYKHPVKSGLVTIAGKPSDDIAPGTLASIKKQAGLK